MSLIFALRVLCDVCFYLAFANVVSEFFGGGLMIYTLPLFALCGILLYKVKNYKKLRYVPLAVLGFNFIFFAKSNVDFVLLLLPVLYLGDTVRKNRFVVNRLDIIDLFFLFLKVYGIFALGLTVLGFRDRIEQFSLFYAVMVLGICIYLMRLLRHDPQIMKEKRFICINLLGVVMAYGAGAFICSDFFVNLLKSVFSFIYYNLIMYVLLAVAGLITILLYPLWYLLGVKPLGGYTGEFATDDLSLAEEMGFIITEQSSSGTIVAIILLGIVIIGTVYWIYKKLSQRSKIEDYMNNIAGFTYPDDGEEKRRYKQLRGPQKKVRELYRKILVLLSRNGLILEQFHTSKDIEDYCGYKLNMPEESAQIRNIYIDARYGENETRKDEIKRMKEIYSEFKKKLK